MKQKRTSMDKRGTLDDIFTFLIIILGLAVTVLVVRSVFFNINDTGLFGLSTLADKAGDSAINYTLPLFDIVFFAAVMIGVLSIGILAFQVKNTPAILFIAIIVLSIAVYLSANFSNVYEQVSDENVWGSNVTDGLTLTDAFWDNAPLFITVFGALILVATYGFSRFAT